MNNADRNETPYVRNGLIQMSLGANPLEISPLQMATLAMRLVTLNRHEDITTLYDGAIVPEYELFDFNGAWDTTHYVQFHRQQVLGQLRRVLRPGGTASALNGLNTKYNQYYFYAKTGTINITDRGKERLKHLLVIISNTELETLTSVEQLQNVKYYVLYMSYYGVKDGEFNNNRYRSVIEATIQSEQFKKYMNNN